jgi:O-antigen/teichoic acid export membrane protein
MALISFLFGKEIVVLIFSKQYLPSSMAFSLLMLNFYFKVMATTMGYSFVPAGYPSIPARISAVACIISIVGSLILVPILGFMGVVYSLIVLNIISMLMYYRYLVKFHLNPNIKKFLQPLVLLIIVIGPYYIISQENIFMKSLCLVLNVALSWFFIEEIRRNLSRFFKFIQNRKWQKKVF